MEPLDSAAFLDENGQIADPCGLAKALYAAEISLAAGQAEAKIEFRDRGLWVQPANLNALRALRQDAQQRCLESKGISVRPRRFAVTAGNPGSRGGGGFTGGFTV